MTTEEKKKTGKLYPVLLRQAHAAIALFTSRDETRPILCSVRVTPEAVEATDSYRLCRITHGETGPTALDFPPTDGSGELGIPAEGVNIDARALKEAFKRLPSRSSLPALNTIAIAVGDSGRVKLITNDLDTAITVESRRVEWGGAWPDFDALFAGVSDQPVAEIFFQPSFLKQMADAFMRFAGSSTQPVRVRLFGGLKPAEFFMRDNDSKQEMRAILMPVRGSDDA